MDEFDNTDLDGPVFDETITDSPSLDEAPIDDSMFESSGLEAEEMDIGGLETLEMDTDIPETVETDEIGSLMDEVPLEEDTTELIEDPVVDDIEPVTDDIEPVTDDIEPVVDDIEPVTDDIEPVVDDIEPVTDNIEPVEDTEPSALDAMNEYMSGHNYGLEDAETYQNDPEWQELNNNLLEEDGREPIEYDNTIEDTDALDAMNEYMSSHNYGLEDAETYRNDPEWQELNNNLLEADGQEPIEYDNSVEDTETDALDAMNEYMSGHNYGLEDAETYRNDPEWQELNNNLLEEDGKEPIEYDNVVEETEPETVEPDVAETIEPVTDDIEPVTDDIEPVTDDIEPVTDAIEPVTDDIEPVTDDIEPVTDDIEPVTDDIEPVTEEIEPFEDLDSVEEEKTPETEVEGWMDEVPENDDDDTIVETVENDDDDTIVETVENNDDAIVETVENEDDDTIVETVENNDDDAIVETVENEDDDTIVETVENDDDDNLVETVENEDDDAIVETVENNDDDAIVETVENEGDEEIGTVEADVDTETVETLSDFEHDTEFRDALLELNPDLQEMFEGGEYYMQGLNEYGFQGTCGETTQANTFNRMLGTNEFSENDVLNIAVNKNLCSIDFNDLTNSGGTSTDQFMELYEEMNNLTGNQLEVERFDYADALSISEMADRLEGGSTLNIAVDSCELWDEVRPLSSDPHYTDHWISVTGVERTDDGEITGFKIIDSGGGESYLDLDKFERCYYGPEGDRVLDPTCIVVSRKGGK